MEFNHENNLIELTEVERRVMQLPDEATWTISEAHKLLVLAEEQVSRVDDIDPSVTPYVAERQQLIVRKQRDGLLLRSILNELSPYAADGLADEATKFLDELDS